MSQGNPIMDEYYLTAYVTGNSISQTKPLFNSILDYLNAMLTNKETKSYQYLLSRNGKHDLESAAKVINDIRQAFREV